MPPTGVVSPSQSVNAGSLVTLDGNARYDSDGDSLTYLWTQISGPTVMLSGANTVKTIFMAPNVSTSTIILQFKLTVRDKGGLTSSAVNTTTITVNPITSPPLLPPSLPPSPSPPPQPSNLYDNFEEDGTYTLLDGQTSPNRKWINNFNGFGSAGVQDDGTGTGNHVFFMYPATSTSPSETHANSVSSTKRFSDFELDIDAKTIQQLRQNSPPNPWEAATVFFRQTDTFHYYAFVLKTNGIEFDKKDCNTCTDPVQGQQFLVTASSPTLQIGAWSHWKITAIGNHITIIVDGNKVVDYIDQTMSPQLSSGAVVMYDEDAYVNFDNVYITPQ